MITRATVERITFSPGEFAVLFGKSQTWGYRQIYAGKVKTITEYGRILIPAAEIERILETAARYDGLKKKPARTKAELQKLKPELQTAWKIFLAQKRSGGEKAVEENKDSSSSGSSKTNSNHRKAALERLLKTKATPKTKTT